MTSGVKVAFASKFGSVKNALSVKALQGWRVKLRRKLWVAGYARMKFEEKPPVPRTKSLVERPTACPRPEVESSDQIALCSTFDESRVC